MLFSSRVRTFQFRILNYNFFDERPGTPVPGFREPIPDVLWFSYPDASLPDVSEVRIRTLLDFPDLHKNFDERPGTPVPGLGVLIPDTFQFSHPVASCFRSSDPGTLKYHGS